MARGEWRIPAPARHQYRREQGERRSRARLRRRPHARGPARRLRGGQRLLTQHAGAAAWQAGDALHRLLAALADAHARLDPAPPILLKLAPEIDDEVLGALLEAIEGAPIAGLILTNTTTARPPGLVSRQRAEEGGLSGPPLAPRALEVLRLAYSLSGGRLPLIGVGGIDSAEAAYARIRAGASLDPALHRAGLSGPASRRRDHARARGCSRPTASPRWRMRSAPTIAPPPVTLRGHDTTPRSPHRWPARRRADRAPA